MSHIRSVLACVLLLVSVCQAKTGGLKATTQNKGTLPNWTIGLGAVVGFLFIIFFILVVKRLFFKSDSRDEEDEELKEEREVAVYENNALDTADESKTTNL